MKTLSKVLFFSLVITGMAQLIGKPSDLCPEWKRYDNMQNVSFASGTETKYGSQIKWSAVVCGKGNGYKAELIVTIPLPNGTTKRLAFTKIESNGLLFPDFSSLYSKLKDADKKKLDSHMADYNYNSTLKEKLSTLFQGFKWFSLGALALWAGYWVGSNF